MYFPQGKRNFIDESKMKDKRKKEKKTFDIWYCNSHLHCNVFQVHGQESYFQYDLLLGFPLYNTFSCTVLSLIQILYNPMLIPKICFFFFSASLPISS